MKNVSKHQTTQEKHRKLINSRKILSQRFETTQTETCIKETSFFSQLLSSNLPLFACCFFGTRALEWSHLPEAELLHYWESLRGRASRRLGSVCPDLRMALEALPWREGSCAPCARTLPIFCRGKIGGSNRCGLCYIKCLKEYWPP
jgi:hypothetical protein